jgi:hypothetical protein
LTEGDGLTETLAVPRLGVQLADTGRRVPDHYSGVIPGAAPEGAHSRVTMGIGAAEAIACADSDSDSGRVVARFDKAAYVRFPDGIIVLTAPSVPPGPLHVSSSVGPATLAAGDVFVVPGNWRDSPTIWRGELPELSSVSTEVLDLLARLAERSALLRPPYLDRWQQAVRQLDLATSCRLLGGLGPGLTPSGDDALAGMFLAARLGAPTPQAEHEVVALAGHVDTHEIARAFLVWAARGQSIEPVHRLLAGDATAAIDLLAFGHTSGADLALGLLTGLRQGLDTDFEGGGDIHGQRGARQGHDHQGPEGHEQRPPGSGSPGSHPGGGQPDHQGHDGQETADSQQYGSDDAQVGGARTPRR